MQLAKQFKKVASIVANEKNFTHITTTWESMGRRSGQTRTFYCYKALTSDFKVNRQLVLEDKMIEVEELFEGNQEQD